MLQIIQESKDYIVLNKPSGLMVHSDGRTSEKTVCDFLIEKFPEIADVGEPMRLDSGETIKRPGIVHRLDKETSGVMVVAKNQIFFEKLKKQFQDRLVRKIYHSFVYENIKQDHGIINAPIGRSRKNFRQWFSGKSARGDLREAITEYSVLKRATDKSVTFVEARPKTGRTHQIRVHFKHIYHPVVCDSLYAPERPSLLGFNRVALHAKQISFMDDSGTMIDFEAEYPVDFANALTLLK